MVNHLLILPSPQKQSNLNNQYLLCDDEIIYKIKNVNNLNFIESININRLHLNPSIITFTNDIDYTNNVLTYDLLNVYIIDIITNTSCVLPDNISGFLFSDYFIIQDVQYIMENDTTIKLFITSKTSLNFDNKIIFYRVNE